MYYHSESLKVIGWMAQPAIYSGTASYIGDCPMSFLLLSTWTWDTFLTLRGTQGFYLNHVLLYYHPDSLKVIGWMAQPAI